MRACIVVEQNDPKGELGLFRFDRLAKDDQGCLALQEVYQQGAVLDKEDRQHKRSCTCVDSLEFSMVIILDASTGDFVVSSLVRSDDIKTHVQPPLGPGTHSLPWHSAADDQYSGRFSVTLYTVQTSLCDYTIFGPLKKALRGKRVTSEDDVKQYFRNWFTTQPREFYETAIHLLVSQWDKCLNSQDQYF